MFDSKALEQRLITYRRDFHRYPEVGWTEFRTSSKIAEKLLELGYEVKLGNQIIEENAVMGSPNLQELEKEKVRAIEDGANPDIIKKMGNRPGVVAILKTGRPGPTVAFRFDIDALKVTEAKDEKHKPYRENFVSKYDGVMHACGHDGHAAVGLVVAEEVLKMKDNLTGNIKFIFQPAEEGVRGALAMTRAGVVDDVDYFFAFHIGFGELEAGDIGLVTRAVDFLSTNKYEVEFIGKASHAGAAPEDGKNALLGACNAALNLHMIPPHSKGNTRINVGILESGTGLNIIPDRAVMKFETRGASTSLNEYMVKKAKNIIKACCQMYDLRWGIKEIGMAVSENGDIDLSNIVGQIGEKLGFENIIKERSFGASDDATIFMKRVRERGKKALYYQVTTPLAAPHHYGYFDFDEEGLFWATLLNLGIIKYICG